MRPSNWSLLLTLCPLMVVLLLPLMACNPHDEPYSPNASAYAKKLTSTPTITSGISTGIDGYMVHLRGTGFQPDSYVDVRTSTITGIIASYSGAQVHFVENDIYIKITDVTQRNLFNTNGLYFWVVNPTPTGSWSSGQFVRWASPPPPQMTSGASTGSDGYTIRLAGQYFHSDSRVDVRTASSGPIIATYSGTQVTVIDDSTLTFYISDATQRNYLNSSGLYFWVVNLTPVPATWCGPAAVTRIAPNTSYYDATTAATSVIGTQTILQRTISTTTPQWLLLTSDGNITPTSSGTITLSTSIYLDNVAVSNISQITWGSLQPRDTHSYNNIAAKYVSAGIHTVKLIAVASIGSATFGVGSNLSSMLSPAESIIDNQSDFDIGPLNYNTLAAAQGNDDRSSSPTPHQYTSVVTNTVSVMPGQPIIALGSGTHFQAGHDGDSAIGLWADGNQATSYQATWGLNDICSCAEQRAPYYAQAYWRGLPAGSHQIVLGGSEFYWSDQNTDNPVIYKIASGAHLVTLTRGIHASGVLYSATPFPNAQTSMLNTIPITVSSPAVIASGTIFIPSTSNGVVYFATKTRQFGDNGDATLTLQLRIDGVSVGSQGKQSCGNGGAGTCISARTLSASYLAAGANKLAPGNHTVQAIVSMQSSKPGQRLYATIDAPVIWFD